MERVVDVTYRGLRVARGAKLVDGGAGPGPGVGVGSDQGFLELDAPLPVGTRLVLVGEGDFRAEARVVSIVEQEAGGKATAGMRLDWSPPKSDAATTMELDPDTEGLLEDAGTSGGMPAVDESTASSAPSGESRGARRRRKKAQNGRS